MCEFFSRISQYNPIPRYIVIANLHEILLNSLRDSYQKNLITFLAFCQDGIRYINKSTVNSKPKYKARVLIGMGNSVAPDNYIHLFRYYNIKNFYIAKSIFIFYFIL